MPVSDAISSLLKALRKRLIRIGRTYQGQSVALIALCRHLAENDTNSRHNIILQLADTALLAAEEAGKNKTPKADSAFKAIRDRLEERYAVATQDDQKQKLLKAFMDACSKDEAAATRIKRANENSSPPPKAGSRKKISFVILKSLHLDSPPTVIREDIDNRTTVEQILWIFSRRKGEDRITLKENPHFYLKIPQQGSESEFDSSQDGKGFHRDPLTQLGSVVERNGTVYVLRDRSSRLYFDVTEPRRVFGNVWQPKKKIILKDICGVLDSEDNVRPSLQKEILDFWYRRSPADASQSPAEYASDDHQIIETEFESWYTLVRAAVDSRGIDLMIRAKQSEPPQDWNPLRSQQRQPPITTRVVPARFARQTSSPLSAPTSTPSSVRLGDVPVDEPVYTSQDPPDVRRDAENGRSVHPTDSTRDRRPSDTQSRTPRKPQGSDSQSSLSSGAQKPVERSSQMERPRTAGGFPTHFASQTSSSPSPPAGTHTSSDDVPAKIPQDRSIVREDAARSQRHVHLINRTIEGRPSDSQSRVSSNPQGSGPQPLSSEVQKLGGHSSQRETTARASPRFASQTSSPPSAPASTPTSTVNIPQDRPIVRDDAARGQRHVHPINNTRDGRPSDLQSRTSGYPQGPELRSPLSSGAQKPGERFQEKHVTTPGKSTTSHYAGQTSGPPKVLAGRLVDSSTTSINVTLNVSQPTFVVPAATPPPSFTPAQNTPAFAAPKSKPAPPPPSKGWWFQTIRDKIGW